MEKAKFKHNTQIRVRNYEVDWQGIVHNANYLLYFEVGRLEYLKNLGVKVDLSSIQKESKVVLVRNEIDYKSSAIFDEILDIWTRIVYIKNSSFVFEGIIEESKSRRLVAENIAVHVWLDSRTAQPKSVPDEFRSMVQRFEGDTFSNLKPFILT